jgi:hypothetical protein
MKKLQYKWFQDIKNKYVTYDTTPDGRLYKVDRYGTAILIARKETKKK